MLGYLSAISFIIGVVLERRVIGAFGDTASGFGQLFVGLAAFFAAVSSWMNNRKIGRGIQKVEEGNAAASRAAGAAAHAATKSIEVADSLNPEHGPSLMDLLNQLIEFEKYQHIRNHDMLNAVAGVPLMIDLMERILNVLENRETGKEDT